MSVAFRRESDDEHLEPKFEIPIPPGPNLVTARGLAMIEAKVEELQAAIAGESDEEALKALKRELRYWGTRQATVQLTPPPEEEDVVGFGSRVSFRLNGEEKRIDIVGDDEADPPAGRIAFSAPLARAMMDREAGERVTFGSKADAIEILAADAIPDDVSAA